MILLQMPIKPKEETLVIAFQNTACQGLQIRVTCGSSEKQGKSQGKKESRANHLHPTHSLVFFSLHLRPLSPPIPSLCQDKESKSQKPAPRAVFP